MTSLSLFFPPLLPHPSPPHHQLFPFSYSFSYFVSSFSSLSLISFYTSSSMHPCIFFHSSCSLFLLSSFASSLFLSFHLPFIHLILITLPASLHLPVLPLLYFRNMLSALSPPPSLTLLSHLALPLTFPHHLPRINMHRLHLFSYLVGGQVD